MPPPFDRILKRISCNQVRAVQPSACRLCCLLLRPSMCLPVDAPLDQHEADPLLRRSPLLPPPTQVKAIFEDVKR